MSESTTSRMHGFVSGRVQGVGFRYFAQQLANELGLTGWVKNTFDNKVEFVVEGTNDQLAVFMRRVSKGPNSGYVSDVSVTELAASGEFRSFRIRF